MSRIGVLALQGAFREHAEAFRGLGAEAVEVRLPRQLDGLDGLVIPGGESTTISLLLDGCGLRRPILELAARGWPLWGTCAGLIMLAKNVGDERVRSLELMDLKVVRNAFGRQVDSFEVDLPVPALGDPPFRAIFIRAPIVEEVGSPVEVLARLPDGRIAAARQGRLLATAFHPELTGDTRFHRLFLEMCAA
ncbi:MAG: pyridoxal 5'-phosphate synthase glutaminase subunit PdxT [Sphingomonadaceae bacterium]